MRAEIQQQVTTTFSELYKALSGFSDDQFDTVPFEGSWTAGQVTEHIVKAISGFPKLCNGHTEKTARQPDEKVASVKQLFLDFNTKLTSPEFIEPTANVHDKKLMLEALEKTEKEILTIVQTHDLTLICKDYELPGFGPFTIIEWISFTLTHIQRHTHQLKNISQKLTALKK